MLHLLENGKPVKSKMVNSKDEDIMDMHLRNKIGLPMPGAKWRNVTKDCKFYLPTEDKEYIVENSTPFDDVVATHAENEWRLVTGTIERDHASAGSRYAFFKIASGGFYPGYYPANMGPDSAFAVSKHPDKESSRLLSISVLFSDLHAAQYFVVQADKYVVRTYGVLNHLPFMIVRTAEPHGNPRLILESHYVPNEADDDPPNDSPVYLVEVSDMDISALSPTVFSRSDTVFKNQRIEADVAFARSDPEGAHIFPKAKCKGKYEWLDKPTFNRLALSRDGHKNFDGTANGKGVRAETSALVALEPTQSEQIRKDHSAYTRIENRLWCRSKEIAMTWRPYLKKELSLVEEDGHFYFTPLYIYRESNKIFELQFEQQQESNGALHNECITAIPGVDDHTTLDTWDSQTRTVAQSEIMFCLLRWSYLDARQIWKQTS